MTKYLLSAFLFFNAAAGLAQATADTAKNIGKSPLKALTDEQYKAYTDGVDINGLALVAQANHYPDPGKTLLLKKNLGLSAAQVTQISNINTELQRKMKEMGAFMIKNEKALDALFKSKKLDDGTLIFYTNRYGLYQGELRNAILQAYVKVQAILDATQRKKYEQLQKIEH
ncbi:Spy/CpxP family protein refolding chaperone [Mucilaginibacter paludis]|uniref:Uncharacterized protein n=1 Tax=Mucilaginibacter paludis DSM 18603 TaxID=714943 RepID=H1YFC4_9SPHI|nr:hypothetical protein [Mucilaginibacter paludis]EHQ26263.1 hypothetical protein Mucpa_2123 [Mucilaginibacter paludis DSM 18603]